MGAFLRSSQNWYQLPQLALTGATQPPPHQIVCGSCHKSGGWKQAVPQLPQLYIFDRDIYISICARFQRDSDTVAAVAIGAVFRVLQSKQIQDHPQLPQLYIFNRDIHMSICARFEGESGAVARVMTGALISVLPVKYI